MRILVVEDDDFIAKALTAVLSSQHYAVEVASDGQAGWELVESFAYDLILLDVMLPKLDGISLCRRLRSHGYQMPILLLTGRDSSHDKAIGLDAGADDYLVKPFDQEELFARVRALLRRGGSTSQPILQWGNLRLDPSSCEVTYETHPIQLTSKEYSLLELFLRNSRRVFSCSAILDRIWSFDKIPGEEAVRTQIKGLRQKLKTAGAADLIETVYGIGYRLKPLEAHTEPSQHQQQTLTALTGVWERFKGRISEQVAVLEQAAAAVLRNTLTPEVRAKAEQEAHTLAGSLGTFGLSEGSAIAKKIEHLLPSGLSTGTKEAKHFHKLVAALRQEIGRTPDGSVPAANPNADERPKLLIIDSDRQLAGELATAAQTQGIRAEVATLAEARDSIARDHPDVVLLDPNVSNTTEEGLMLLAEISKQQPAVPVFVFTAHDSLSDRVEVARLGGCGFLQKPVPLTQVLEAVAQVLQRTDMGTEAVVMVVDDDPQILATLRTLLEPWGLKVITLDDPRQFWEKLAASSPDLLILDIKMPHLSGFELCQVVRNDSRWGGLPVLFLTARTDADTVNQVFAVGADDYVSKPIVGPELVTRIINRLERIKLLRSLAQTEPLTVADYQRHEAELKQAVTENLRLTRAVASASDGVLITDPNQPDNPIIYANPAVSQIAGYQPDEIVGKNCRFLQGPDTDPQTVAQIRCCIAEGREVKATLLNYRKDGQPFWNELKISPVFSNEGALLYFVGIQTDITERKRAESGLRQVKDELEIRVAERTAELISVNERLQLELDERKRTELALERLSRQNQLILNSVGEGLCGLDLQGKITFVNPAAANLLGYSVAELIGQSIYIILPHAKSDNTPHELTESPIYASLRDGTIHQVTNELFWRQNNTSFPVEYVSRPIREAGEIVGAVITFKDITERQVVERMKDEFISVVSHELRTPLTSIHGSLGLLASGLLKPGGDRGQRLLEIAVDSTERLVRLINDILDIERIESGKVKMVQQTCDAADLMIEAVEVMQSIAEQHGVNLSVTPVSAQLLADRDRIIQTLTNLLSNAIKFSFEANTVWLTAQNQGDQILFRVKDRGRGIPTDKLETIFERFQQVDVSDSRNHEGTGLGLAICRSIVQQHGGCIWVESTPGEGSTFYFTLPILQSGNK